MPKASVAELTTTSYALLGLLAVKPWSAYDLAQQMKRGFAWYWPRAERAIYAEPKKLVAHGLARAHTAYRGRQQRTVYEITPAGRRAVRRWLAQASEPPRVEAEALVRLTFLEQGDITDAALALASLREAARELERIVATVSGEYLKGLGPFPERLPEIALTGSFLLAMSKMFDEYATWAERFVASMTKRDPARVARARLAELRRDSTAQGPAA
jgi:PadR family transcriptional regulator, regulatory protein AphA